MESILCDSYNKVETGSIKETGASTIQDMGKVMGALTSKLKGKADMSLVSQIVKSSLS
ncbi:MAG: GatB/YqeY domain-containing protein [bacterium]